MEIINLKNGYVNISTLNINIPVPDNFTVEQLPNEIMFKNVNSQDISGEEYGNYIIHMRKDQVLQLVKKCKFISVIFDNEIIKSIVIVLTVDGREEDEFIFDSDSDQFINGHVNTDFIFHDFLLYDILKGYESISISDREKKA